ncbi:obscurin-like protein 1 isoform X10 [Gadus macrocephalus]|uniref:obscurin-like protein 1 isoform X10 n=1 Tax=Gadus macrocephalus TaxID=80720 RepID=UPI0028CB5BC6|nr:obscurin-like protein 1 isoform X10 [Gadus macrocephalus]
MDVFGGAPRFLAYPRPVVVQSGTDAVLKCQIGGDPRPAVIWESNNIKIDTQGRYRVFEDGNVYNLIISSVTSEDSGQYICKAKNSIGETYAAATLKVEGEAQELEVREENKPRFLIKPLSTRVGRGDDAVFSCKLWGNPRPDVVWEKDGRKLHEIFESTHFSVGCQDGGWFQLKIFKTRAPDGGVYTCKARNEFGEGLAGAVLLVDAGPGQGDDGNRNGYNNSHWKAQQGKQRSGRLMSNRLRDDGMTKSTKVKMFAVTEGKHAKFRCFVTGKPKPEIIWRKDGRLILSGRRYLCYEDREGYFTLKVLYCKQKDNGVYVCAASNTAGQTLSAVHLTVKEPPVRFKQPLIDLEVWERDLAVLECEVPEDSVPITWYLEDRRLQPGAKYGMEEWGTKRRLTIRDIGVDDDGIYLCEMPDGGRSIAEVAVKGTIVRKLPRKVDVLEGENAAFCVEVEEEEMDIHWYKEGVELRETHQTILKSFGRTHILVFVNTNPQDSGLVMFFVGRSKTSSQLRVKAAKHSPPSCPVSVQINTERANAALLSWVPAQDSRKNPPSGYVLERQEVGTGSQEWLQCLTTDSATSVEILGDSVPCEADYRFRICSVNKYGKSNNVEFPRAVHLVPVARIQAPLQDALVPEGQDACFTIELSASVIGTWFLNGTQLQDDERYTTRRSRTHQSLRIRGVRETDNGAEITFIAYGIRDSAALYIQAPLVKFSPLSEMDRNKFIEEGNPIVLYCELSDPAAPVHWYKNGVELQTTEGLHIQSEGTMRRIVIQSAEFSHSGVYCCDAIDDVIRFNVEVEAPPVKFTPLPDEKRERAIHTGSRMELQCELSDLSATVHWYKDGSKLLPQSGVEMLSDGLSRMLVVDVADFIHSGLYSCKTKGDAITFNVDVTVPPVKFSAIPEQLRNKTIEAGCPIVLQCVVSDPEAQVCWYKGPTQLLSNAELEIQSEGHTRSLVIQFAEPGHSGVYSCASEDDTMEFRVEIRAIPVKFSTSFDVEQTKAFEVGAAFELECEVTEPTAEVCWYKDGHQLCPQNGWDINSDSSFRRLIVQSAELFHAGRYSCETSDDTIQFTVEVKAPMLPLSSSPEVEESNLIEVTCPLELQGQWSDSAVPVLGPQDEEQDQTSQPGFETGGFEQTLVIEPTHSSKSGAYYCATEDDVAKLIVQNEALPVTCPPGSAVEKTKPIEAQSPIVRQFEISDPVAKACWYKDGTQIYPQNNSQSETAKQTMFLPSDGLSCEKKSGCERKAEVQFNVDKKAYQCHSGDDSVAVSDESHESTMDTKAPPVRIKAAVCETERNQSCEVSDPCAGVSWYKDGLKLLDLNGQAMGGSEGSVRSLSVESALPYHAAPPVKFSAMSEADQTQTVMVGCPIALLCELSDPTGQVHWSKDGAKLIPPSGVDIQSDGNIRKLTIQSAQRSHSGVYQCETKDDAIQFSVDVKALPLKFCELPEDERSKSVKEGSPLVLRCELCQDTTAEVFWSRDGTQLLPGDIDIQSDGLVKKLCIHSVDRTHAGVYQCSTAGDSITFTVEIKGCSQRIKPIPMSEKFKALSVGSPVVLQCELQDPVAQVSWCKDGVELYSKTGLDMKRNGHVRKLVINSAKASDSGLYSCCLSLDVVTFQVEVQDPAAEVNRYKDVVQPLPLSNFDVQSNDELRSMNIQSAEARHRGLYSCEAMNDIHIESKVDVAAPVWSSMAPEVGRCLAVAEPISQQRETAHLKSRAHLSNEDRVNPLPKCVTISQSEDRKRTVVTQPATSVGSFSGVCNLKTDDVSDFNDCYVEVKVHPVTFVNSPEEERFKSVVEQDQLVLACEVSQADAPVQWYMDGVELQACDNVTMRSADTARTLSIRSARLSDTGTYTCRAGDSALIFKVNIREPPVTIVYPKEDVHLDRHVPEEIILSCELSRPNGVVNWYKDGQKLQESENIKLKVEGPYRRLKLICSRVEDSGEYVCDTADDSIFFHLKITEPPVRIVSPSQSQMELCQQTSERMVLSCEISRANALVRWYRDGLEVEENKNLILEVDGIYRRLIIPETSVQDSAEYVCDTADDSVTFFVNIAEPPVRFMRPRKMASVVERFAGEAMVLDCEVSRANAEVTWKRNGEEVEDSRKVTILEDVVLRQLTVHCLSLEDAGQYVCDAKDDVMDFQVKVKELPVRILGKTDATAEKKFLVSDDIILVCELSRANASVSWYKDSVLIDNDTRVCCEEQGAFRSLVVLSAELEDSGEYSCDAGDDKMLFCITVKEPPVQIIGNSGTPEQHILVAGDDLILECEVSRPNCPVQWLWNSKLLKSEDRIKIDSCDVVRRLVLSGLQPSDSGKYICDAIDDKMITLVEVQQPPVKFVNKQPNNNISACENECVSLCAIVSQERANVRWLKDGRLLNEDNVHISIDGANHNLTINPLKLSNAGVYVCDANTDEMSFTVIVKEIKATFSLPLENITGLKGSMLTLRCELSKPKGDVQWLKNGQEISPSRRHTIRAQGRERSFAIHQLADEDAGEYTCESTDDRTSTVVTVETPRTVEFIAELHNITVREGEDATFKCVVSPEDTHLTWCLNGERVHQDDRLTVISNGLCHTFCIKKCRVSDSARVTADAEGLAVSQANLQVQEQQVLFTKSMAPLTAEEFGEATLEVEVSLDSGEVQWMRQGVLLHPGAKYSLKRKGRKHTLTVHKLAVADRGIYSCESLHDRTQAQLTVEPRKVTINTGLKDIWTTERETASFEVVLSHADVPGSWLRNGVQLKPTKHWRISTKGHVHSLTVSNLAVEDTGSFSFCVENLRTSARLVVREPPVTFLRHLEDQKFPEGSVVSIECELSRHNVDVRWMKNGAEVKPGKDQRIFAMGRKRFLQIMKGVVGDSAQYTCDAADTSTSCTIEIYEREVLVVQGLQDQDIQEDQNAVFVCDLSVEDVPGEWYRNGDRIQPTSSIKIRQEGTKHFLLMVNVRGEDSGEIKFVARHVESVASLKVEELPVNIVNPLQDQTVVERSRVLLDCTVSNPRCSIRWYKGPTVILPSERFEICSEGCYRKLIIQPVELRDQGTYSVQVGEYSCSAHLTVEAQSVVMVRPLEDVEVGAPGDACFQCEISHPVLRAPVWSLRGEQLQPSATVFLEKMGPIHRLTLRETAPDMSGEVGFTLGPACSTAKLTVRQVIPD